MVAGLDLSGLVPIVESWISTTVLTFERQAGSSEGVLDDGTGELVFPTPDPIYVGPGAVQPLGRSEVADPDVQRVMAETNADYRALIPIDVPVEFRPGDTCRVITQSGTVEDPLVLERTFEVVDLSGVSTFSVVRFVYLKQLSTVAPLNTMIVWTALAEVPGVVVVPIGTGDYSTEPNGTLWVEYTP